jgi:hypothetical protein
MKSRYPHSSSARWTLLVLLALTVSTATSFAQNVGGFIHAKIQNFQQTSSAAPVVNSTQPFQFGSLITMGTATINSATLTFTGTASPRTYDPVVGTGDFSILDTFTTLAQLNSAYQNGNFTVSIDTSAGTFSRTIFLFPFTYPTTPMLTVPASNWQSGALVLDPTLDYTFTWNAFSNAQAADVIELVIRNSGITLNPFPATQTSYTLPAGSLQPNATYTCDLGFIRVAGAAAGDANIGPGYATLVKDTGFTINTVGPTPTPQPLVSISGAISYCSNPIPGPVPNVTLTLTGSSSGSTLSDGSGNYAFSSLASGGSYTVTPTKAARVPGSPNINTVDVVATQRHFLNLGTPLTGCRLMAADVNGDSSVNTVDVIAIQRFYLSLSTGIANTGKYQFTPVNRTYTGIVSDQTAQNYDTLVFGDVASSFVELVDGPSQTAADDGRSASATFGPGLLPLLKQIKPRN